MNGWSRCAVMAIVVALATTALVERRAASDDCLHVCAETDKDDRGCCPAAKPKLPPKTEPKVLPKTQPKTAVTPKATGATTTTTKSPARSAGTCPSGMVHVPAGTFTMGSGDAVGNTDEHPAHTVTLGGYCLDKTEVTVAVYGACVAAGKCSAGNTSSDCNGGVADKQDHPINCVDWNQARAYCTWASKRLPTEAEWERAARGDDGRTYPWGNEAPSSARLNWNNERGGTTTVGAFPTAAGPFGALDLVGNVWEWTADLYGWYAAGAATSPTGATTGPGRVVRGGGWSDQNTTGVRAANRTWLEPGDRYSFLGFRCARGD